MRKLLNTLFVTSEGAFLTLEGETVCVELQRKKIGQFPLHTIESIVCFSYYGATPALMGACADKGINLAFYNPFGRFLCRVTGKSRGNVVLRKQQYRASDDKRASCQIARNFILGKVFNCRWSIDRTLRDHLFSRSNEPSGHACMSILDNRKYAFYCMANAARVARPSRAMS